MKLNSQKMLVKRFKKGVAFNEISGYFVHLFLLPLPSTTVSDIQAALGQRIP
jgi:hypothetical protein